MVISLAFRVNFIRKLADIIPRLSSGEVRKAEVATLNALLRSDISEFEPVLSVDS